MTDGSGASTSYTYDVTGRMKTVSNGSSLLATYNYNPDSTISSVNYSTGVKAAYTYDRDKNITALVNKNPQGGAIGSYGYTYDNNGNQLTKAENGQTTTYTYDELNRLKTVNYAGAGLETYTYDNAGNRLSKVLGTDSTTYTYDSLNRLTQSTNNGVKSAYTYDANGNLTGLTKGSSNTIYTYDGFNRLTETVMPDGQWMDNAYDAFGLRTATIENGTRYEYTLDRGNVIAENAGEANAARYIRGISLIVREGKTGDLAWYLFNAHGDVTNLVDGSGSMLNSYTYDAFGNTMTYSETVANRFMYAGEQFDRVTGQYYLRARYYDPATSRMLTEDTYRGYINEPLSLNLYTYCYNDPINNVDPSGYMPVYALRGASVLYNSGVLNASLTSTFALVANGLGAYTAFHEIAQLNVAKALYEMGYGSVLEYRITSKTEKNKFGKCKQYEADIVSGNMVWEIKPSGTDGTAQLKKYMTDGDLIAGFVMDPIMNIPVLGDIKMGIVFDKPGVASYYFYKLNEKEEEVIVPATEVVKEYNKRAVTAIAVAGVIIAATLAEDALTAGAGTADDIPSLIGALSAAGAILAH